MPKGLLRGFLGGVSAGVGRGIENYAIEYTKRKDAELQEQKMVQKREQDFQKLQDPNTPLIEKASIASQYNPQMGTQLLKEGERAQREQHFWQSKIPQTPQQQEMRQEAPRGTYPLLNAMQTGLIPGIGANAFDQQQPQMQAMGGMQQQAPQQIAQQRQQNPLEMLADEDLIEGIGRLPERAPMFKAELDRREAEKKIGQREQLLNRQERMQIHKDLQKEDHAMQAEAKTARKRISSFNVMRKNLGSGKLDPRSFKNVVTTTLKGTRWENLLKSPERAEFEAAALSSFEGMKDLFGTRLSDADLRQAAGKVPDPTKSIEANMAIIDFMEFQDQMKIAEEKVGAEVKKENGGFRPLDYHEQIRQRMQQAFGEEADKIIKKAAYGGSEKPKFDPSNPEHDVRRKQVLQQVGGDKIKANQILQQEFMR
jgi:hypothetical protein